MRTWILGRFDQSKDLVVAANKLRGMGYSAMEAFMPYPAHEVMEAVRPKRSPIPYLVFIGGLSGFTFGWLLQWFCGTYDYPINIGGRDIFSPTVYVPILFECVILFSVLTAVTSVFVLSGLPMPYHPFFNNEGFHKASTDSFILAIQAEPSKPESADEVKKELSAAGGHDVEKIVEEDLPL